MSMIDNAESIMCKKLIAIFQEDNLMLEGSKYLEFYKEEKITIVIEQMGMRKITVVSETEESAEYLYEIFTSIERLLMIFDGRFVNLRELMFKTNNDRNKQYLSSYASEIMQKRLSYYKSADFCNYKLDKLLNYETIITTELFDKWIKLLEELDIVHQMFLYSASDSKMPVDVKCAFLIEISEPLVEVVKSNKHIYASLNPGERGTSLKMCIDALISKYGLDIFEKELDNEYDKFLQTIVNSRVRIMHIKRKQKGLHFNGVESILYAQKMILLYRRIIFEVLGIETELYKEKMILTINSLENWKGVQAGFLKKLK